MLKVVALTTAVLCFQILSSAQLLTKPEACRKLQAASVDIFAISDPDHPTQGRIGHGTGFIVSPDGWIVTAGHVVFSDWKTKTPYAEIDVVLPGDPGGFRRRADVVAPKEGTSTAIVDFALLKIAGLPKEYMFQHHKRTLEALPLGNESDEQDVELGSEIALLGTPEAGGFPDQLCLFGTFAGIVQPDIYYQGAAVGGMSGGPIMSLRSGKVIGIVKARTASLNTVDQLDNELCRDRFQSFLVGQDAVNRKALCGVLDLLDTQFNNGIGAGAQITAAKYALEEAQRTHATR